MSDNYLVHIVTRAGTEATSRSYVSEADARKAVSNKKAQIAMFM